MQATVYLFLLLVIYVHESISNTKDKKDAAEDKIQTKITDRTCIHNF